MKRERAQRIPEYLEHILNAIDRATLYVAGMNFDAFERDTRTQDAVLRALQVIGEAANQIRAVDAQFADSHSSIPWDLMYGMRNRIVRGLANR